MSRMSRMSRRFELRDRRVRVARVRRCDYADDYADDYATRVVHRRPLSLLLPPSPLRDPMRLEPAEFKTGRASDERPITGQQPKPNEPLRSRVGVSSFGRPVIKSEMKAT